MFYYKNWENFCKWITQQEITPLTAEQSLSNNSPIPFIVFKHDVEDDVPNAFKLAEIENRHGIRGSYYVQAYLLNNRKNIDLLKQMQTMGHEISYHYDVLDANSGNYNLAEQDFNKWLERFKEEGFTFKTICQHGNPVKERIGYNSNRDFFRNNDIKSRHPELVDMVVNYSDYVPGNYIYISDAGYMWKHITDPENNDINPDSETIPIGNFKKLIKYISNQKGSIVLSTHPHRWRESKIGIYSKIVFFKIVRKSVRTLQKLPGVNRILDKFYFLAKKI